MKRALAAIGVAAAFAVALTIPSSAAPADPVATPPAVERGDALLASRGVAKGPAAVRPADAAPPQTEGIAGGFVFVPITPYRTIDTRNYADGFVFGGDELVFTVLTDQNGNPVPVPTSAVAVTYNLTVTNTFGSGFCSVYPGPAVWPGNSSINWTASNQTIAAGGTSGIGRLNEDGEISVYCGPTSFSLGADVLLDITGYYF